MSNSPQARSVFLTAAEILSPDERQKFLADACAGDEDLRLRVEALLKAHDDPASILDRPAVEPDSSQQATIPPKQVDDGPGARIGPYKLLQQIGEGGMGVVYLAEQEEPVRRRVALKIIKPGMDTRQVIARFEAERQALALMDHVNIARVLDAGATDSGRPYFVMELVKGSPITSYCDNNRLTLRERLELFVQVCRAVQHAHQKGIIHRDIKPSNVLVCLYDGQPVPKVIDFGVAKAIEQKLTEKTMFTQHGQIVGTLEYMSPEQAEMSQLDIDTRSDIYSLGVLLYELLTGSTPITREQIQERAFLDLLVLISESEPVRPSTRLTESADTLPAISAQRKTEPRKLSLLIRDELDWIVMKALQKDRTRRYETASFFAADIERHLNGDAVEACPPSTFYKFRKLANRHRAALAITAAFAMLLIIGLAVSTWQAVRARMAENIAQTSLEEAKQARTAAEDSRVQANSARLKEQQQRKLAESARDEANSAVIQLEQARKSTDAALKLSQQNLYFNQIALAQRYWLADDIQQSEQILDQCPSDLRKWEWRYLKKICHAELQSFSGDHVAYGPDGKLLAIVQPDSFGIDRILVWDVESKQQARIIKPQGGGIFALAFTNDGAKLAYVCEDSPSKRPDEQKGFRLRVSHSVRLVDIESGNETMRIKSGKDFPQDFAISHDDQFVALSTSIPNPTLGGLRPEKLTVWNIQNGEVAWEKKSFGRSIAFHPERASLVAVNGLRNLTVLNLANGESEGIRFSGTGQCFDAAYSPNGTLLAKALKKGVEVAKSNDAKPILLEHPSPVFALAFSHDSRFLATGDGNGVVRIWNVAEQTIIQSYRAHAARVIDLSFHPAGGFFASSGADGNVRIWDSRQGQRWKQLDVKNSVVTAASNHRKRFATFKGNLGLKVFLASYIIELRNTETGQLIKELASFNMKGIVTNALAFSPDGSRLAGEIEDNMIRVWDADTGNVIATLAGHSERVRSIAFDGQAKTLCSSDSHEVRVWNLETSQQISSFDTTSPGREPLIAAKIALSLDGKQIAVVGVGAATRELVQPGRVEVWESDSGRILQVWPQAHRKPVADVAFSHDGKLIATAGWDEVVKTWNTATGENVNELRGHTGYVWGVAFSPDDERVVSTGFSAEQPVAKIWDPKTGQEILSIDLPSQMVRTKPSFDLLGHSLDIAANSEVVLLQTK